MKIDRKAVLAKTGGRCAYCGCELSKGRHVDHVEPIRRNVDETCEYPENDCEENYLPACASCNINKHSMPLESFRRLI